MGVSMALNKNNLNITTALMKYHTKMTNENENKII
jgi:hypothetical protein